MISLTKTVVFDLDGTLISCRPRQMAALRAVSRLSSRDLSEIWMAKRDGMTTHAALLGAGIPAIETEEIIRQWVRIIESPYYLSYDRLLPGAAEALQICRCIGFRTVILTARKSLRGLMIQANAMRLNSMADQIFSVDPRDGPVHKARELRRISAEAMIGDSEVDAQAAASAEVSFYPVSSGQRSEGFLRRKLRVTPFNAVLPATLAALSAGNTTASQINLNQAKN